METRQHRRHKSNGGRPSVRLAQNFLTSEYLVRRLVATAEIGGGDTVLDIGAGRGIITAELARQAGRVIAIEKDPHLSRRLRERFRDRRNVQIINCDFLTYRLPNGEYKVFASIPYNRTAAIVRKLVEAGARAPTEAYLIMQREPARKFAGLPRETLFSVLAKPLFSFEIVSHLRRKDFYPQPDVDSVMLKIARRSKALVDGPWASFVSYGFTRHKRNLRLAYKNVFTYTQWKRLAREIGFDMNATATELSFEQWMRLFQGYVTLARK